MSLSNIPESTTTTTTTSTTSSTSSTIPTIDINHSSTIRETFNYSDKMALLAIDVQNDFCKGGSLAVSDADDVVPEINKLIAEFNRPKCGSIFFSQDWHPDDHMSFASTWGKELFSLQNLTVPLEEGKIYKGKTEYEVTQMMWPNHCVQGDDGAKFHKDLKLPEDAIIIQKGTLSSVESYSAFGDEKNGKLERTRLHKLLKEKEIKTVVVVGIATDYCVLYTIRDARKKGYNVHFIKSASKGVTEKSTTDAIKEMEDLQVSIFENVDQYIECRFWYRLAFPN